ncbi:MAG: ABC transporter permease [Propionibacteriaceae bacterium]|jgi:ABC-type transport system involved in multi-copper enzyme maturation permease subunit|nr:ABC transporter permease [Propionibacteriaceae bacterium]
MSATTARPAPYHARLTFAHIVQAEWLKLFALHATRWILIGAVIINLAVSLLVFITTRNSQGDGIGADIIAPTEPATLAALATQGCVQLGQVVLAVLAVLCITHEYATGTIHSTFVTVPRRSAVLAAKAIVLIVCGFVVMAVSEALACLAGFFILDGTAVSTDLFTTESIRLLGGGIVVVLAVMLLALAFGAITRSTAVGVGVITLITFLPPALISLFAAEGASAEGPSPLVRALCYTPGGAGGAVLLQENMTDVLSPAGGILVLLGWVVVFGALAFIVTRLRRL